MHDYWFLIDSFLGEEFQSSVHLSVPGQKSGSCEEPGLIWGVFLCYLFKKASRSVTFFFQIPHISAATVLIPPAPQCRSSLPECDCLSPFSKGSGPSTLSPALHSNNWDSLFELWTLLWYRPRKHAAYPLTEESIIKILHRSAPFTPLNFVRLVLAFS